MRHARSDYDHIQDLSTHESVVEAYRDALQTVVEAPRSGAPYIEDLERCFRMLSQLCLALRPYLPNADNVQSIPMIPPDEPVFLLRAKDRTAPSIVRAWARLNAFNDVTRTTLASPIASAALTQADRMEDYAREHYAGGKEADAPRGVLRV